MLGVLIFQVKKAIAKKKQVVFSGYSSAGPIAILATLYFLENPEPNQILPPRCLTFGSPLFGDRIFGHALKREGWSDYFTHFVTKYDMIPRIMLSPSSTKHAQILNYFKSKFNRERINPPSSFYLTMMGNASSVASYDACNLMGCRNSSLDITKKSFIKLSHYRPSGTYIFCIGNENLVVVKNPVRIFHGSKFSSPCFMAPCFLLHVSWLHVFFSIFHGSMFSSPYFMAPCFLAPCRLELLFKLL